MSGGREAQLAFYYQNLFAVFKILSSLREGKLLAVKVEQKIRGSKKEVDIILQFKDEYYEYYEVKSGEEFTGDGKQIKDCLSALFTNFKRQPTTEKSSYFVIINKDYLHGVTEFVADIKRFNKNKTITSNFKSYCSSVWKIKQEDIQKFHEFIGLLSLNPDNDTEQLKVLVLNEIEKIKEGIFINADHALLNEDLLNRLIDKIVYYIKKTNGVIDLEDLIRTILDWVVRNEVAYKTAGKDIKALMKKTEDDITPKLQKKFPSVQITSILQAQIKET